MRISLIILFLVLQFCASAVSIQDSIGLKQIGAKKFILHKVEKRETWFALSRRYNVSVDSIKDANSDKATLKLGLVVKIPWIEIARDTQVVNAAHANADAVTKEIIMKHKVAKGETTIKIAALYGIQVSDLNKWNAIKDAKIDVGQILIVNANGVRPAFIAWNKPISRNDSILNKTNSITSTAEMITETGQYAVSTLCKGICMRSIPPGQVVSMIEPLTKISYCGEALNIPDVTKLFSSDIVVVVSPEIAKLLGYAESTYHPIQITYPAAE